MQIQGKVLSCNITFLRIRKVKLALSKRNWRQKAANVLITHSLSNWDKQMMEF